MLSFQKLVNLKQERVVQKISEHVSKKAKCTISLILTLNSENSDKICYVNVK